MKFSNVSKVLGAGLITASIAFLPNALPAQAQLDDGAYQQNEGVLENEGYNDDGFDWGWLGLLGLIGLAGLARDKKKHTNTVYTDPVDRGVTTTDYRR